VPVIDVTPFRLVLTLIERENLKGYSLDVETVILLVELEEEIYMKKLLVIILICVCN
jgi:hypothetical protein